MSAYNGSEELRAAFIAGLKWHREQDAIVQGSYGDTDDGRWRGCAVGCGLRTLYHMDGVEDGDTSSHAELSRRTGIPIVLHRLQDSIFERLPNAVALDWPVRFASSVQAGADLSMVWPRFAVALLSDPDHGACRHASGEVLLAVQRVSVLYEDVIAGRVVTPSEWEVARLRAAAVQAERQAAWAERQAAWAAAQAAAMSARAAMSAVQAAARAERAEREAAAAEWQADTLVRLLTEARNG